MSIAAAPQQHKKGKSKYAAKKGKQALKRFKKGGTAQARVYTSLCCNADVKKPTTGTPITKQGGPVPANLRPVGTDTKETVRSNGLGGWRCVTCGKPCSVKVSLVKAKEEAEEIQQAA